MNTTNLASWLTNCDDTWLRGYLMPGAGSKDPYRQAVTAGLTLRLHSPSRERLAQIERGIRTTGAWLESDRLWTWARSLGPSQVQTLKDLVIIEVGLLLDQVSSLEKEMMLDESWRRELAELCLRRDDLAAAAGVLQLAGHGASVVEAIEFLDEEAGRFMASLPVRYVMGGERARRASSVDLDAWWL